MAYDRINTTDVTSGSGTAYLSWTPECNKSNTTGATSGAGTTYPSEAPEFTPAKHEFTTFCTHYEVKVALNTTNLTITPKFIIVLKHLVYNYNVVVGDFF
jgi:hypothetical protein